MRHQITNTKTQSSSAFTHPDSIVMSILPVHVCVYCLSVSQKLPSPFLPCVFAFRATQSHMGMTWPWWSIQYSTSSVTLLHIFTFLCLDAFIVLSNYLSLNSFFVLLLSAVFQFILFILRVVFPQSHSSPALVPHQLGMRQIICHN